MPRRKTRSDDEVLAAAGRVLARQGPHRFTLGDVAREAGLSPATLIQRFGTKQGLLEAFSRWSTRATRTWFDGSSSPPGLPRLLEGLGRAARTVGSRDRMISGLELLLEDVKSARLRAEARAQAKHVIRGVEEQLRAAEEQGEIVVNDVAALAELLHAVYNGALVQWALRGTGRVDAWVVRFVEAALQPYLTAPDD